MLGVAREIWWHLGDGDWLSAFEHHPQIGADIDALREKFAQTAILSSQEQSGALGASEETLKALAGANAAYLEKYGFIFIVCATGKSADEMLSILGSRMDHEAAYELRIAAGEQAKITELRLLQFTSI